MAVNKQLHTNHLSAEEVDGDGNCFYRAISVGLYGNQLKHAELRKSVAEHVRSSYERIFSSVDATAGDSEAACKCADDITSDGTWAAEDAILATADFLQRDIIVYIS